MVIPYLAFLCLLALERSVELLISRRHAARALARGGVEFGQTHLRWMKVLHTSFLLSCAAEVTWLGRPFYPLLGYPMLALVLLAQSIRYWTIASLGPYWSIRVIVIPGTVPVSDGPFRYLRHPNYLAVIVEIIAVPLVHSAWLTALVFSLLNAWLLVVRIRCEEAALGVHCKYAGHLGNRKRLIPTRSRPQRAIARSR